MTAFLKLMSSRIDGANSFYWLGCFEKYIYKRSTSLLSCITDFYSCRSISIMLWYFNLFLLRTYCLEEILL
jgi:hypothetical protein